MIMPRHRRVRLMAEVRKATLAIFDSVYPLLQHFDMPDMDRERWQRLLGHSRSEKYDHFGYVLMDGKRAVGFLGGLFHEREIAGKMCSLCNLFCWYVMEEYRQQSLMLMLAFLQEPDLTITSLTPSREASLILKQFKFQELETGVLILPLIPVGKSPSGYGLTADPEKVETLLSPEDRKLFKDHDPVWCRHLVVWNRQDNTEYCHVVFNRVIKKGLAFTQVYHISNPDIFRKNLGRIQRVFFKLHRTLFTVIDRRLLPGPAPFPGFSYTLRYPRLYRPAATQPAIEPSHIDNLYTELLFLKKI